MQLLLQEQRVRAERDELLLGDQALHDLPNLAVDQRRAAFIDRIKAFLDREPTIEDGIGIVDLAATDAGKIATKQRLQHQHERIAFAPQELLPENVGADTDFLEKRDSHSFCLPVFFLSSSCLL